MKRREDFGTRTQRERDAEKANLWLRKLKWPRVTEAQLRRILMGRDNYCE